ncbi:MAG TPA: acyltransferase [Candidatus Acidoferrales bacterium]|jgi:peptidoglycan/LPS O-acetylase OafA/YrhL|nr:acyltransferase [Candidatus Acidoferrales bacterium]
MAAVDPKPHANPSRSWARLDGVDLLRGLAIFFVLMNHVNMRLMAAKVPYTEGMPRPLVNFLIWNAQYGVQMFFAVSGFLITSTALRRWGGLSRVSVRDFYLLRFASIAPLLLSLLAVLSVLHAANVRDFVIPATRGGLGRALFAALTFHVNVLEARHGYLPGNWDVLWSLSVEEMFYLFFPLACVLLARPKGVPLLTLLCTLIALGPFARTVLSHGNEVWQEYSYLGGMDAIAMGCLTAIILARSPRFSRAVLRIAGAAGIAFLLFVLCFKMEAYAWGFARTGLNMSIVAIGTCLVIVVAAQTGWRAPRVFTPLLALGRRSYEIYLTHMFIVFALLHVFMAMGKPMAAVPFYFIATILFSALLGEIVARFFSEPMNRSIRRRFGDGADRLGSVVEGHGAPLRGKAAVES